MQLFCNVRLGRTEWAPNEDVLVAESVAWLKVLFGHALPHPDE